MFRFRRLSFILLASLPLTVLFGCTNQTRDDFMHRSDNFSTQDRELGYTAQDFRNAMAPRPLDPAKAAAAGHVPELAPVISEDKKNILPQPLVSVTVNQDVPLRDIFFELAKQADVDLELDPTISGSVIFTAYNRPFDQVVDRLCDMASLRYTFKNNVLHVERDTPYLKTYHVQYLGIQRNYTSTVTSNSAAGGSSGGGSTNGSSSSITSKTESDFWTELQNNITQLINNTNQQVNLTDQSAPIATPNAIPAVAAAQLATVNTPNSATPAAPGTALPPAPIVPTTNVPTPPTQLTVSLGPATPGLANPTGTQTAAITNATSGSSSSSSTTTNPYVAINRQGGLVNVFATQKQHEKIATYIDEMMRSANMQVLIEAKVFEVDLNDENSLGIDWSLITGNEDLSAGVTLDQANFSNNPFSTGAGAVFQYTSGDLDFLVQAISRFGTVHTLSSPRLTVMNNQTAVLNVSNSRVFFKLTLQRSDSTATTQGQTDVTSEASTVPEGLIITVHPSIDPDTHEISMNLRPSITRVIDTVNDPAVTIIAGPNSGIVSPVPELSTREIDSIVKMQSGSTIVMGGLMQDRNQSTQTKVPILAELPILGNLFRAQIDANQKTELVIMLHAVVSGDPKPDESDRDLYNKMALDRHPVALNN